MNERIRLLATEAFRLANDGTMADIKIPKVFIDEFAQLIVAECARVILETPVDYMETDTMHRIRDNVKQHFGTEQ